MKTMIIYEPAMCCETGICGVGVDPELIRLSAVINNLKRSGITIKRYNLNSFPQEFIDNIEINKLINSDGVDALPATVVDGKIVKTKKYPTNAEIVELLDIPVSYLEAKPLKPHRGNKTDVVITKADALITKADALITKEDALITKEDALITKEDIDIESI